MRKFSEDRKIRDIVYDDLLQKHYEKTSLDPTHIKISSDAFIQAKHEDTGSDFDRSHAAIPSKLYGFWIERVDGLGVLELYTK